MFMKKINFTVDFWIYKRIHRYKRSSSLRFGCFAQDTSFAMTHIFFDIMFHRIPVLTLMTCITMHSPQHLASQSDWNTFFLLTGCLDTRYNTPSRVVSLLQCLNVGKEKK
ncbi:hypothetical protein AMECASPLE_025264 [Ameca splendens]|uniref:Uncharacterized protein n=1 Tax=Ameca splendens TaxID=208324 RepID=A0ABV1A052_9TELE